MAEPEPPKSKYQCLVDAVTDAGLASKLPPIAPGTEVDERPSIGSPGMPPLRAGVEFAYEGIDGNVHYVEGHEGLASDQTNPTSQLFLSKSFSIVTSPSEYMYFGDAEAHLNMETKQETNRAGPRKAPAKPGTVGETVDKIIACRTPEIS
jgi:hypothetical protein